MTFRLLIDECLSPRLVQRAIAAGHPETTCVRDRGWAGSKDWELIDKWVAHDFTFVTHNAVDFRGYGQGHIGGEHARQTIHAGLICLNSVNPMTLDRQQNLFDVVLQKLATLPDLVNQALEVFEQHDGAIVLAIYAIPE